MLKQQARVLTAIAIIVDMTLVALAFITAHSLISRIDAPPGNLYEYLWFLPFILPAWFASLYHFGIYGSMRSKRIGQILANLLKAHLTISVVASSMVFFAEPHVFGRKFFLLFVCLAFLALVSGKLLLRFVLYQFRRRGYNVRTILLAGSGSKADEFIRLIEQHAAFGFRIIGIVGASSAVSDWSKQYPYYGDINDVVTICKREMVDEVVFCLPRSEMGTVEILVHDLSEMGITSRMVLDLIDFPASRSELSIFHDELPMLTFYSKAFDPKQLLAKRILDVLGASVGLMLLGVLLPLLAFLIRRDSPGPIFFGQERVGENGRRFRCWKLRSMYIDAEERKKELLAQNEMSGAIFKIKNDPRVTPIGRLLRKSSLDEFPQFWNVLRGEMSLVGTRPPTPDEVEQYENWHRKRLCIKPGITGLWQVTGRNQIQDFNEIARLDIRYIENWSVWLDLKIIFKTVWVVVGGRGAS
jgi:exopolysaccharide biosynthesis polyprenyl glycosylphosphotransferase